MFCKTIVCYRDWSKMVAESASAALNNAEKKPKTEKELKKEAMKAEKLAKFREKEKKMAELKAQQAKKTKGVCSELQLLLNRKLTIRSHRN